MYGVFHAYYIKRTSLLNLLWVILSMQLKGCDYTKTHVYMQASTQMALDGLIIHITLGQLDTRSIFYETGA